MTTLLCNNLVDAQADVIYGASCVKKGEVILKTGKKFTCVKNGKKLSWNKGVLLKETIPKPTPIKTPKVEALTWENTTNRGSFLVNKVWDEISVLSANVKPVNINREILIGPNTPIEGLQPKQFLSRAENFFYWAKTPQNFRVFYFSSKDLEWAKQKFHESYGKDDDGLWAGICSRIDVCGGGNVMEPNSDWVHMNIGGDTERIGAPEGFLESHEYVHVVQHAQKSEVGLSPIAPQWLVEGQANFFAVLITSTDYAGYSKMRGRYRGGNQFPTRRPKDIIDYLNGSTFYGKWEAYGTGFFLIEALSGIYGVQTTMTLVANTAKAKSFDEAFEMTYGEKWDSVKPKLAEVTSFLIKSSWM